MLWKHFQLFSIMTPLHSLTGFFFIVNNPQIFPSRVAKVSAWQFSRLTLFLLFFPGGSPLSYDIEVFIEVDIHRSILICIFWFTAHKFTWPEGEPGWKWGEVSAAGMHFR